MKNKFRVTPLDAVTSYRNGNVSDFKQWLKRASKTELLEALRIYAVLQSESLNESVFKFSVLLR